MGGDGRVADQVFATKSTRGQKYSNALSRLRVYFFVVTRPFLKRVGPTGRRVFLT